MTLHRFSLVLDYVLLQQQCQSPDLVPALDMQPAEGLGCLGAAVYEVGLWLPQAVGLYTCAGQDVAR